MSLHWHNDLADRPERYSSKLQMRPSKRNADNCHGQDDRRDHMPERQLIAAGRSPETPAIAVRWATRPDQESIEGTLASLPRLICSSRPAEWPGCTLPCLRSIFNCWETSE